MVPSLAKRSRRLAGGFVHVLGGQCRHHSGAADGIQDRADDTAMDAVVGKVTDQLGPHVDAGRDALGRDLDELEAQGFVEQDFFFVDLAKTLDVFGLQNDRCT